MDSRFLISKTYWSLPVTQVLSDLHTSVDGLSEAEAAQRLQAYGSNAIKASKHLSRFGILLSQFKSPMIFVLVIAGSVALGLKDIGDAIFIFLAALVNAFLGFYQEDKAARALDHLKQYVTDRVRVTRGGTDHEIDTKTLVPGDIIHIAQGNRIPADCRVIYSNDLQVDQAVLTGESLPVEKHEREAGETLPLADQHSMVFAGTTAIQGIGKAVVAATGQKTQLGRIASLVSKTQTEQTPLQKSMTSLTLKTALFVLVFSVLIFFIARSQGMPMLEAFLIMVAILVAAVPEGLPVVMTVILAIGVQRLAKRNGIVRRLSAAETLGSTSIILTDKTGTLTQAKMTLSRFRLFSESNPKELMHLALLNTDVVVENPKDAPADWRFIGKPLEIALAKAAAQHEIHFPSIKEGKEALHILPFNSLNKFAASVYHLKSSYTLSLLGAPEILLKFSDLSEPERLDILSQVKHMADEGDRVVAVAVKEIDSLADFHLRDHTHLKHLKFLGTISFRDPLRPGTAAAFEEVKNLGIRVIILTGDHAGTARAVAREIGIEAGPHDIINGSELDSLSDEQLEHRLRTTKIVSRVSPDGKLRILLALKKSGEIVAISGDGVNDAPALHQADIGVAMGSGADVSKDVADLVLLDDNFETLVIAITEGRKILSNVRKAIVYLGSTLFNEIFLIGGSLIMGLASPLSPLQILWVNFFTDSFPAIGLAFDGRIDSNAKPASTSVKDGIFNNEMRMMIGVNGVVSSLLLFFMYGWLLQRGYDQLTVRTFIFGAFASYSLFLIFAIRSLRSSIFSYNPFSNRYLVISVLIGFALTLAGIYMPFFQHLFDTVALSPSWLFGIFLFGIFNVGLIEITKLLFKKD